MIIIELGSFISFSYKTKLGSYISLSIKKYSVDMQNIKAQFIKVFAKNLGACPKWHKGFGGKAWLFVDEVTIDTRTGSTKGIGDSKY